MHLYLSAGMRFNMRIDMCMDRCVDTCMDMCASMCADTHKPHVLQLYARTHENSFVRQAVNAQRCERMRACNVPPMSNTQTGRPGVGGGVGGAAAQAPHSLGNSEATCSRGVRTRMRWRACIGTAT